MNTSSYIPTPEEEGETAWMNYMHPPIINPDKEHPERITIGVIGYSSQDFDKEWALCNVSWCIDAMVRNFEHKFGRCKFNLSSGLTDLGIPAIAYRMKRKLGSDGRLIGVACEKAKEFPCYPVDEVHIIGKEWGDESDYFLNSLDALIRIGGGTQSLKEYKTFTERFPDKPAHEVNL